jgi:hypothetical protein
MKQIRCKSGLKGWQAKLHDVYTNYSEFADYCFIYNNHARLGFDSPELAWNANPVIQGSVIPSDYQRSR